MRLVTVSGILWVQYLLLMNNCWLTRNEVSSYCRKKCGSILWVIPGTHNNQFHTRQGWATLC
jgi:hypothetical protein